MQNSFTHVEPRQLDVQTHADELGVKAENVDKLFDVTEFWI